MAYASPLRLPTAAGGAHGAHSDNGGNALVADLTEARRDPGDEIGRSESSLSRSSTGIWTSLAGAMSPHAGHQLVLAENGTPRSSGTGREFRPTHRHIPLTDRCSSCLFPETDYAPTQCATGEVAVGFLGNSWVKSGCREEAIVTFLGVNGVA